VFWRLARLYPAYWLSLLFAILLFLYADNHLLGDLFWQFSGFSAFAGQWGGLLNPVGWYIGLLVSLYLLFPFISKAMERKPWITLIILFIIQMVMTYWINSTVVNLSLPNTNLVARWFPLCNLFFFGIGIFLVRKGYYLKWEDKTGVISWLGKLTFYVFLFHIPILPIAVNSGIPVYFVMLGAVSMIAMMADEKIQSWLRTLPLFAPAG
jgi:peptidoglycan/LPS O-acetylase OafA/YrhL